MPMRLRLILLLIFVFPILSDRSVGQTARRQNAQTPQSQEQTQIAPADSATDSVANEIALLRKSVQTLNSSLRDIGDRLLTPNSKQSEDSRNRIAGNLSLLMQAEQRAEILRKQLLELIEKETSYRSRLAQIDEDMRPENVERALNPYGTTRTVEARDTRRRVLENDRKGFESLLALATQSRQRLEEDVRQADSIVTRLRQRLMPLIEKEIDKINPN